MSKADLTRRDINRASLLSLFAAIAAAYGADAAAEAQNAAKTTSSRREVIKQVLPGDPKREISLVEVNYPPGTGSPAHAHANGVMAFVVSGSIASQVGDGPERTYKAGDAWWEPVGAIHRVSRNPSATVPARLLAIYIAPEGATTADLMKPL